MLMHGGMGLAAADLRQTQRFSSPPVSLRLVPMNIVPFKIIPRHTEISGGLLRISVPNSVP